VGSITQIVFGGNLVFAIPIALLAGVLAFASPCVLPLVPGYLAYVGGFTGGPADNSNRRRLLTGVALFVLGFSVVFVGLNVAFAAAGTLLIPFTDIITRIAGIVLIVMGFVFIGQFGFMQRTFKPEWRIATGLGGAPLLGVVFGLGWTPCISPTLVAVLSLSSGSGSVWRGVLLGIVYCLGLGIPFLLVALGLTWVSGSIRWVKRHIRLINIIGGALLIVIGILMVSGLWRIILSHFQAVIGSFVTPL
jgi:cytochrome c-type biogenesis protein